MKHIDRKPIPFLKWFSISEEWEILSFYTWRILNPSIDKDWYLHICLNKKNYSVHRLVAAVFLWLDINNRDIFVCHKNDIRTDNRKVNLFLWTIQDNNADKIAKGRWVVFGNSKNWLNRIKWEWVGTSKLLIEDVVKIKEALILWAKILDLSNQYGVDITTISKIRTGETRSHIQVEWRDGIKKFPSVNVEKVKELYWKWYSPKQIAEFLWNTHWWVCGIMKKHIPEYHNPLGRKLTDEDILTIKNKILAWVPSLELAKEFNMSASTIRRIKRGKLWSKITGFEKEITKPAPKNMRAHREQVDIEKIISMYKEGKTNKEIEVITWTNYWYIWTLLRRYIPNYKPKRWPTLY